MQLPAPIEITPRLRAISRLAALLLALCVAALLPAAPAGAQSGDPYTITVPVDVTAANAIAARDKAQAEGQQKAARQLLERLTAREDRARLPQITEADLRNLVRAFEVANERTSPVRYLADLTVVFNPEEVRAFLGRAGVAIIGGGGGAARSRPVVILPVWRTRDQVMLFNDRNPWFVAWQQYDSANSVVPLIVPAGDVADIALITAEQALTGDRRAIAALAQKYGTDAVVLAIATYQSADGPPALTVVRFDLAQERRVVIPVAPRAGPDPMAASVAAVASEIDESWKSASAAPPPADQGQALRPGQPPLPGQIPGQIPGQPQGGTIDGESLRATIPVRALYEWIAIRNRLSSVPLIRKVEVNSLVVGSADITIIYAGTIPQLRAALAAVDLQLNEQGSDWMLRSRTAILPPGAAQPPVPVAAPPGDAQPGNPPATPPANAPLPSIAPPASIGAPPGLGR